MVDRILEYPEGTRLQILAPVVTGRKGEHVKVFEQLKREGYIRMRVNGEMHSKDRKSTRLNSSHVAIPYAASCLKKKKTTQVSNTAHPANRTSRTHAAQPPIFSATAS